jgi:5'-nucleotidase
VRKTDPRGGDYYWIGGSELGYVDGDEGTDVFAVAEGCVSVTPLQTDLTSEGFLPKIEGWKL